MQVRVCVVKWPRWLCHVGQASSPIVRVQGPPLRLNLGLPWCPRESAIGQLLMYNRAEIVEVAQKEPPTRQR